MKTYDKTEVDILHVFKRLIAFHVDDLVQNYCLYNSYL